MILKAPINTTFKQVNRGEKLGDIYASRNIDLERDWGKIRASSPVFAETLSSASASYPQSTPFAFAKAVGTISASTTDRFWTVASDGTNTRIFQTSSVLGSFTLDAGSPNLAGDPDETDILAFNSKLYVASGANLYSRNSGTTWTTVSTGLQNDKHLLSVYGDRLYISNDQEVYSLDTSDVLATSGSYTLNIDIAGNSYLSISTMRSGQNGLWIGTYNADGGRAKVIFWDGVTENAPDQTYKVEASGIVAMTLKDEVPYVLGSNGVLFRFNGSYFEEVARFAFGDLFPYGFDFFSTHEHFVHPNGMIVVRDEILMAVNNRTGEDDANEDPVPTRVPSGVWAWSEDTGLYHKHSLPMNGDTVEDVTDYGQVELVEAGAMFPLYESDKADDNFEQSDFFVGYGFKATNSTTKYAVGVNRKRFTVTGQDTFNQASLIITPFLTAEEVLETWTKFWVRGESTKMLVSYRTQEYTAVEANITWVNTTSLTTTSTDFATIKTNFEAGIEYEFEGLQGDGAGQIAYITNITENAGTYTVTLDQTITGATTNTARARFDRWTKIGDYTGGDEVPSFNPDKISSKIQFKVYSLGDLTIEGYVIKSNKHEPAI